MAKKKREFGLSEQFQILLDQERKADAKQAKKEAKRAANQLKKDFTQGVKRLNVAVKEASERLITENSTAGGELILINTDTDEVRFERFDGPFEPVAVVIGYGTPVPAWVNGGLALVPEHYRLAVPLSAVSAASDEEIWFFTSPKDLLSDLLVVEENVDSVLTEVFVDPIVEWLNGLGRPAEEPPTLERPVSLEFDL